MVRVFLSGVRIMKMPKNTEYIQEAMLYKRQFERLLSDVVSLSNCMVSEKVLTSGEVVTKFTYGAERKTEELTGITIDSNITLQELKLMGDNNFYTDFCRRFRYTF